MKQVLETAKRDDRTGDPEEGVDAPLLPDIPPDAATEAGGAGRSGAAAAPATSAAAPASPRAAMGTVRMMGVRIQEPVVVDSMASRSGRNHPSTRRGRSPVRCSPCSALKSSDTVLFPATCVMPYRARLKAICRGPNTIGECFEPGCVMGPMLRFRLLSALHCCGVDVRDVLSTFWSLSARVCT